MAASLLLFVTCFTMWVLLAGQFRALDIVMALVASAFVTVVNRDLQLVGEVVRYGLRLLAYLPWLLREVWLANLQVVRIVLDPRLPVDPVVIRVPVSLSTDVARMVYATSITLTPGTITVEAGPDEFVVHALTRSAAEELTGGAMARRVGRIFGESGA